MEDFLKDRPVVEATPPEVDSKNAVEENDSVSPFETLNRPPSGEEAGSNLPVSGDMADGATETEGEDGNASVKTIVERGRVTRIIVTCSCGKVTEIDCKY